MTLLKHDRMKKAAGNTWHFFVLDSCEKGSYTSTISVDGVEMCLTKSADWREDILDL